MGDSSSDDESSWILYKNRPEWKDVEPVPQDDGDSGVVSIQYTERFKDVYDYFRAILKSGEKSERALKLTADATHLNPANYTVWQYRRDILKALCKDLYEELIYISKVIKNHPKNYQVWHHRRILIEWLKDPSKELALTESVLSMDAKNYHAWQHRQWVIQTYKLFDEELNYVDQLLNDDIRNNSAWNQRYFVHNNGTGFTDDVVKNEIKYTIEKIKIAKENESAWNFLRGLLLHSKCALSDNEVITKFCEEMYTSGCRSPFLLALIVDMCDEQISSGGGDNRYTLERATKLCKDLATEYDKIREHYWYYMMDNINKKAAGASQQTDGS